MDVHAVRLAAARAGQRLALDPQPGDRDSSWATVVGLVPHMAHEGLDAPWRIQYYFPYAQRPGRNLVVAVGTVGAPAAFLPAVRQAVRELNADLPLASVSSLGAMIATSLAQRRLSIALLAVFSVIAVVLASVGIYGSLSYSVARRSRELGIRRALGGPRTQLLGLVLRQGMSLVGLGVAAGLTAGFALTRLVASQLYQVKPGDPWIFGASIALLVTLSLAATLVPALRAMVADPMVALRSE